MEDFDLATEMIELDDVPFEPGPDDLEDVPADEVAAALGLDSTVDAPQDDDDDDDPLLTGFASALTSYARWAR